MSEYVLSHLPVKNVVRSVYLFFAMHFLQLIKLTSLFLQIFYQKGSCEIFTPLVLLFFTGIYSVIEQQSADDLLGIFLLSRHTELEHINPMRGQAIAHALCAYVPTGSYVGPGLLPNVVVTWASCIL